MTFFSLSLRYYALILAAELTFRLMKECGTVYIKTSVADLVFFLHLDPGSGIGLFLIPDLQSIFQKTIFFG
jgi:hypothetical protein